MSPSVPSAPNSEAPVERSIQDAANAWAGSIFGAPWRFADLITGVEVHDEIIRRVVTQVVRREIHERREPSSDRQASTQRLDPARVDPFAYTDESLRSASEYTAPCGTCRGNGQAKCDRCKGKGQAPCLRCLGSGQQRSEKTNRWIKCKVCKGKTEVPCDRCDESGLVACGACGGSGHERAWLAIEETARWLVATDPAGQIVGTNRVLGEARPLATNDLSAFSVTASAEARGPLVVTGLAPQDRAFVLARGVVDPRLERVTHQQFLRLAAVRRHATFEMCGMKGTLVLSGNELVGTRADDSMRPIQKRLTVWAVAFVAVAVLTAVTRASLVGTSSYFRDVQLWTTGLWALSLGLAAPAIGGLLRAWRGGFRKHRVRPYETVFVGSAAVAFVGMIVMALGARPSIEEVHTALTAEDTRRAREVVEALKETHGAADAVRENEDAVMLAEALKVGTQERLEILDQVASRSGSKAPEAAATARRVREDEIRRLIAAGQPTEALAAASRWFPPTGPRDPAIADLVANAHDAAAAQCQDDLCRFASLRAAASTATTPERETALSNARNLLIATLAAEGPDDPVVARVQHMHALDVLAQKALAAAEGDAALGEAARTASARAASALGEVPLIGADRAVVAELLGGLREQSANVSTVSLADADVYAAFDSKAQCRGLYVVGHDVQTRTVDPATADKILSQAIGRSVSVHRPTGDTTEDVRWAEGAVRILARWLDGQLRELRIGEAEP